MAQMEVDSPDIDDDDSDYVKFLDEQRGSREKKSSRLPKQVEQERQEALQLYIDGKFNESFEKLKAIMKLYPKTPELYSIAAMMYEEKGEYGRAAKFLEINAELSAPSSQRWSKIGDLHLLTEQYDQAAYCFGRALKSDSQNVSLMRKRADAYQKAKQQKKAISMFEKIINVNGDLTAIKQCAKLYCNNLQYEKARQILQRAKQPNLTIKYMICQTYLKEKNYQQIIEEIETIPGVTDLNTLPMEILRLIIICSVQLDQNSGIDYFQIFLKRLNQDNLRQFDSVIQYIQEKHEEVCLVMLSILISKTNLAKVDHVLKLVSFLEKKGNYKEAEEILQSSIQKFPNDIHLKKQLGFLKLKTGQEKEGVALLRPQSEEQVFLSDEQPIKVKNGTKKQVKTESQPIPTLSKEAMNTITTIPELLNKSTSPATLLSLLSQVHSLLKELVAISKAKKQLKEEYEEEEKAAIFQRHIKKRKRRARLPEISNNQEQKAAKLISDYLEQISSLKPWSKILNMANDLSRLYILKKYPESKKKIHKIMVLAFIENQKYRRALFFLKYLVYTDSSNITYILLVNLLLRKVGPNALYKSFLSKLKKKAHEQSVINCLFAFTHMESSSYRLAIADLAKIHGQSSMVDLAMATCFLQLASSRNTTNKLAMTNRAVSCFQQYLQETVDEIEKYYNIGRFYSQIKVYREATEAFEQVVRLCRLKPENKFLGNAVYCLMCIHKELGNEKKLTELSQEFFQL